MRRFYGVLIVIMLVGGTTVVRADCRVGNNIYYAGNDSLMFGEPASENALKKIRGQIFDFRFDAAEARLNQLEREPGGIVPSAYYKAQIALLRFIFSEDPVAADTFWVRSDCFRKKIGKMTNGKWRDFFDAESQLQRLFVHARQGHQFRTALTARKAIRAYEREQKRWPTFYDGYKGAGILHVSVGMLPGSYRRWLGWLGIHGTLPQGFEELDKAVAMSTYGKEEAQLYLTLTDVLVNGSKRGEMDRMKTLAEKYPESPLFSYLYGFVLKQNRRVDEALVWLKNASDRSEQKGVFGIEYANYYYAMAQFSNNDFQAAEQYFKIYLGQHRGVALKALAHLWLGITLEMSGRRADALAAYKTVKQARDFDSDVFARRMAERRIALPMSEGERTIQLGANAFDAGHYEEALGYLLPLLDSPQILTPAERTQALYRIGRVYHASGALEKAIDQYLKAVALNADSKGKWAPWSQLYIGDIYAEQGRIEEARIAYQKALHWPGDFDYKQSLEQNAKAGLEKLKN